MAFYLFDVIYRPIVTSPMGNTYGEKYDEVKEDTAQLRRENRELEIKLERAKKGTFVFHGGQISKF